MKFNLLFFRPFLLIGFLLASFLILIKYPIIAKSIWSDLIIGGLIKKCLKNFIPAPSVRFLND